jgi:hypothetical protein
MTLGTRFGECVLEREVFIFLFALLVENEFQSNLNQSIEGKPLDEGIYKREDVVEGSLEAERVSIFSLTSLSAGESIREVTVVKSRYLVYPKWVVDSKSCVRRVFMRSISSLVRELSPSSSNTRSSVPTSSEFPWSAGVAGGIAGGIAGGVACGIAGRRVFRGCFCDTQNKFHMHVVEIRSPGIAHTV